MEVPPPVTKRPRIEDAPGPSPPADCTRPNSILDLDQRASNWLRDKGFFNGLPDNLSFADALATAVRGRDERGKTALFQACWSGELWLCEWLFTHGAAEDVTCSDVTGQTPLFAACWGGHPAVAQWLFAHGAVADVRTPSKHGWTPMSVSCWRRHTAVQRWLLRVGGALLLDNERVRQNLLREDRRSLVSWCQYELALHDRLLPLLLWGMTQGSGCTHLAQLGSARSSDAPRRLVIAFVGVELNRAVLANLRESLEVLSAEELGDEPLPKPPSCAVC